MANTITCRVLLKDYEDLKNKTLSEAQPDFQYTCKAYQYCCYNYTVPHSPWCCETNVIIYKAWYLWVILSVITILICATFFYFRFYQKRQLERRIQRAKMELQAHYRPLQSLHQVVLGRQADKGWEDPPPCYSEVTDSPPPSYNKECAHCSTRDL